MTVQDHIAVERFTQKFTASAPVGSLQERVLHARSRTGRMIGWSPVKGLCVLNETVMVNGKLQKVRLSDPMPMDALFDALDAI